MFYETSHDDALRLGDVLTGFLSATPVLKVPIMGPKRTDYRLEIALHEYWVALTPCCSVRETVLNLTPLKQVNASFFDNPYFEQDLTILNRPVSAERSLPPDKWESLSPEERASMLARGDAYTFLDNFIYEGKGVLPTYEIKRRQRIITTDYYMIDFRDMCRVDCARLRSEPNSTIGGKLLQLSVATRKNLREKIGTFFGRIPLEDEVRLVS